MLPVFSLCDRARGGRHTQCSLVSQVRPIACSLIRFDSSSPAGRDCACDCDGSYELCLMLRVCFGGPCRTLQPQACTLPVGGCRSLLPVLSVVLACSRASQGVLDSRSPLPSPRLFPSLPLVSERE